MEDEGWWLGMVRQVHSVLDLCAFEWRLIVLWCACWRGGVRTLFASPHLQYKTLRTGVNSTLEYLLEFTKAEVGLLGAHAADWLVVSSTKELVRYHTPVVLQALQQLAFARETLTLQVRV